MEDEIRGEEQTEYIGSGETDEKDNETELTIKDENLEDTEIIEGDEFPIIELSEDTLNNIYDYIDSKIELQNTNLLSENIDINIELIEKLDSLIFWLEILTSYLIPLLLFILVFYFIFKEFVS